MALIILENMEEKTREQIARTVHEQVENSSMGNAFKNGVDVSVNIRPSREKLPPNVMVFQTFAYLSATILAPSSCKLLMYLFSKTGYENYIGIDVKTLMEELDMAKRTTIRALNELEENGIIVKIANPSDRRRHDYFINPFGAWKGNSFTRKEAINTLSVEGEGQMNLFGENYTELKQRELVELTKRR